MAALRAQLDLNVDTSKVKRSLTKATNEINKIVSKTSGKSVNFNVNEKSFTQPLGRINASANEFTKSLEASNARVIAFGASVAIIDGISDAFKQLVVQAVSFEKTLSDINAVMSLSANQLEAFGSQLFDAAKNTAQGFNIAAEAALEFSRQGLSTEEVIRRTNDALILTRLTSLKATDAVAGLTAAVNAFGDAGLTTTDIIDKLSAVDVNFAVSSGDLINALQRSGAVAIDAGVELDNLVGIVAALQQTTARGGAVIGNSLKTIFTRIQRPESIRQIEELGVVVRNLSGAVLPADKILLNMAKSFDQLTQAQQSNVVQFSAGIFQANVFRAALKDLAKENSLSAKATEISANASGEAARKNEILNKTISAMSSQAATGIQELAAMMGQLGLSDSIGGALEFINDRVAEIKGSLGGGEDEGSDFAKGLVKGIGNVLTGPAVIAFGAIFIKLFMNIAKFAHNSMKDVLGIVGQKEKVKQMEESIVNVLSTNLQIQQGLNNLEGDRAAQEAFILGIIERQTNAMQEQKKLAQSLAGRLLAKGVSPDLSYQSKGTRPVDLNGDGQFDTFTASRGLNPEVVSRERIGAIQGGYTPGAVDTTNVKGIGKVVYNKAEKIKQFPGMSQPAIMPPKESKAGKNYKDSFESRHGFDPYANGGFIPNFAQQSGATLVMNKSPLKLFGSAMDIGKASGIKWTQVQEYIENKIPITLESSLQDIILSSEKNKKEISGKEKLFKTFNAISAAGVKSIRRDFDVRTIPKKGGRIKARETGPELAERRSTNILNAEQKLNKQEGIDSTKYVQTYDPFTRKGVQNYPVDIIAMGAAFPSYEVKSGGFNPANLISKSLRMSSDRELESWMKSQEISRQGLSQSNLADAKKLAGKLGIPGTGKEGEFTQADADEWGMSEGFVPNFAKDWEALYDKFIEKYNKKPSEITNVEDILKVFGGQKPMRLSSFLNYINEQVQIKNGKQYKLSSMRKSLGDVKFNNLKGIYNKFKNQSEHLGDVRIKGDLFEEVVSILAGQPFKKGKDALDFSEAQGRRIRVPSEIREKIGLEKSIMYGDTESGAGHRPESFRDKIIRELAQQRKLDEILNQPGEIQLPGSRFVDIIARGKDARPKATLKDSLKRIISSSSTTKQSKDAIDNAINKKYPGKATPSQKEKEYKRDLIYDYHVDDIDLNKLTFQDINKHLSKQDADLIMRKTGRFSNIQSKYNNQGFIPNYNLQLGDKYFEKQEVQKALGKLYKNKTGKKLSRGDAEKAAERYTSLIQDSGRTYPGGDFMIGGKKFMANEVALALMNHGQFYRPKEGETIEDFSKGLIPNFSVKTMIDKETGTSLKYRVDKHSPGYADILHSYRGDKDLKGGAFNNFNKLIDKYDSVGSGMLTPQRAGTGPTSWSKIVTMFPQIKNRIQKGLKTRGDFRVDDTEIPFQSLVGLKKSTNKLFRDIPDMEVFLTNFGEQEYFDDGVDFQNLTTSKVKGKGDAAAGFKSKGLIPNFRYWKKYVQFTKGTDGGWGIKGETTHLHGLVDYLEKSGGHSKKEIEKLKAQLKNVRDRRYKEIQDLGYPKMGREGAQYYSKKSAISERPEVLSLKGVFLKNLKQAIHTYNDIENSSMFSGGFVPNFSNPLVEAISRERSAGLPDSKIRIEKSAQLKSPLNPMGLAVTNTRDEPAGVQQGIKRARSMGIDPKKHGASKGLIPNFENGAGVTNIQFKPGVSKKVQEEYLKSAEALNKLRTVAEQTTDASDKRMKVEMDGLQKLFYMQSAISMANGFLQQFAETGNSTVKTLSEVGMAASSVASTFLAAKEASNQLFEMAGIDRKEGVSLFNQKFTDPETGKVTNKKGLLGSIPGISGRGKGMMGGLGSAMKGIASLGTGLLKFAPLIGQVTTGFMALNEVVKFFNDGKGIMSIFDSASDKAAKSMEKLSKSTEALENALGALQSQTENTQKIEDLEAIGSLRTQKQETELYSLRMKEFDIQNKVQSAMSKLYDENLMTAELSSKLSEEFNRSDITLEEQTKTLQKLIAVQKQRTVIEQGAKSFGDLIEKKFDDFTSGFDFSTITGRDAELLKDMSAFRGSQLGASLSGALSGGEDLSDEERLKVLSENIKVIGQFDFNKISQMSAEDITDLLSEKLKGTDEFGASLIAEHIGDLLKTIDNAEDNMVGFEKIEAQAAAKSLDAIKNQLNKTKNKLSKSALGEEFAQGGAGIRDAYVKIIAAYKNERDLLVHRNSLSAKINESQRKIAQSTDSLLADYGAISQSSLIRANSEREIAKINENFQTSILKANQDSLKNLQKTAESFINVSQLAEQFTAGMNKAPEAVSALIDNISKGLDADQLSSIGEKLDKKLSPKEADQLQTVFANVASEIQGLKDNGEVVNKMMAQYGKILDPTVAAAYMIAIQQKDIANLKEQEIQSILQITRSLERQREALENSRSLSEEEQKNQKVLNLIKKKTVDGARELKNLFEEEGSHAAVAVEAIKGEAATLKVINAYQKERVSALIKSGELENKAKELQIEKNRKDAEAAILSLKQLETQREILNSQEKNSEEYKNIIRVQQAKFRQEVVSAQLSEQEARAKEEFLSYEDTRIKLVESQLNTEISNASLAARNNQQKVKLLLKQDNLEKIAGDQVTEELSSLQRTVLVAAERSKILQENQGISEALERGKRLQELINKKDEIIAAQKDATISIEELKSKVLADMTLEQTNKILAARENAIRLSMLSSYEELNNQVSLELEEEITSAQTSALIASEKAIILSQMGEQGKLLAKANELQESSNKLLELENAIRKAGVSKSQLALNSATSIATEQSSSILATREAAMKSLLTGSPEDALAFAQSLEETNKQINHGSRAIDRLRSRMAEMNLSAANLGADLVDIGIDETRSGIKQLFDDIGSGSKTAEEAWEGFGLNLAKKLLDRFTEANIDRIISNLTYAFTGVGSSSEADKMAGLNNHLVEHLSKVIDTGLVASRTETVGLQDEFRKGINIRTENLDEKLLDMAVKLEEPIETLGKKINELSEAIKKDVANRGVSGSQDGEAPSLIEENNVAFRGDFDSKMQDVAKFQADLVNKEVSQDLSRQINSLPFPGPVSNETINPTNKTAPVIESAPNPFLSLLSREQQEGIVAASSPSFHAGSMSPTYNHNVFNRNAERMGIKSRAHSEPLVPANAGYGPLTALNYITDPDAMLGDKDLSDVAKSAKMNSNEARKFIDLSETFNGLEKLKQELLDFQHSVKNSAGKEMPLKDLDEELNKMVVSATGAEGSIGNISQALSLLTETMAQKAQEINNLLSSHSLINPTNPEMDQKVVSDNHGKNSGGIVQKFAEGGFVKGPAGVDKVPAMLTAGEYVIPKEKVRELYQGGAIQNLQSGGKSRLQAGMEGAAQTAIMAYTTKKIGESINKKQDKPPTFDKKKFERLDLGSDVKLRSGDPRLSGKAIAQDPVMQEYGDHLLDLAAYRVQQKNEKFQSRMQTLGSILGAVQSFIMGEVTAIIAEPLNKYVVSPIKEKIGEAKDGVMNWTGKTFGKYGDQYSQAAQKAKHAGNQLNYSDFSKSMKAYEKKTGYKGFYEGPSGLNYINESGGIYDMNKISDIRSMEPHEQIKVHGFHASGAPVTNAMQSFSLAESQELVKSFNGLDFKSYLKNIAIQKNSGGVIPTMLTAGEAVIPNSIAKKIGYDSLGKMNSTGSIPIVTGKSGVDKVGPVGLNSGDFVIKKSSTNKLMRENPHMMRFAMQNPKGFKKAEKRYQGGIVGTSGSQSSPSFAGSTNTATKQSAPAVNRVQPLIEAAQQNKSKEISQSTNNEVTNNINVNVKIDQAGNEKVSSDAGVNSVEQEQALAMKIKMKVMEVIREEKRIGGELS